MKIAADARIVCQFSCGAASAVATKLALAKYGATHDVQIVNAFIVQEHLDNRRFLADCEQWFGRTVTVLRDEKYGASTVEVFRRKQFMKGLRGAPCSGALKRDVLNAWQRPGDVMVLGFTAEEEHEDRRPRTQVRRCLGQGMPGSQSLCALGAAPIQREARHSLGELRRLPHRQRVPVDYEIGGRT
jgi:hypothetical protein